MGKNRHTLPATHPQRPPNTSLIEACAVACATSAAASVSPVPTHAWATLTWPISSAASERASIAQMFALPTARIVSRLTDSSPMLVEAQLMACAEACRICAAECESHAAMHEHCRICGEACRLCEQTCRALLHGASFE